MKRRSKAGGEPIKGRRRKALKTKRRDASKLGQTLAEELTHQTVGPVHSYSQISSAMRARKEWSFFEELFKERNGLLSLFLLGWLSRCRCHRTRSLVE